MISNEVKERLLQRDWYVECKTKQEANLLLRACDDAGITCNSGHKATGFQPYIHYPADIGFCDEDNGITQAITYYKENEMENITDWFFNKIKNNDSKLTPQNAEQEHLVQMLLAKLQGIPVEFWNDFNQIWGDSSSDSISISVKYRLKQEPKPTPISVSRKIWKKINKEFRFIVMDKNEHFYHCKKAPKKQYGEWNLAEVEHVKSPLMFNADGIDWKLSLTERPEDV